MVCGEIIEERTIKYLSTASHAINVLWEDGTRQAYVSLPYGLKGKRGFKSKLKDLFEYLGITKRRYTNLVFSKPDILYPVITEGAAIEHYFRYRGELEAGIWWN